MKPSKGTNSGQVLLNYIKLNLKNAIYCINTPDEIFLIIFIVEIIIVIIVIKKLNL